MPNFKTEKFSVLVADVGYVTEKVNIKISTSGEFYCYLPEMYLFAIEDVFGRAYLERDGKIRVGAETFSRLASAIENILRINAQPNIKEEPVILYNIESHISFTEDESGNIFPNGYFLGSEWKNNKDMYGNHHSATPARGGYSLKIAAMAKLKKTITYGETEKIKYENYYKGESHLGTENPAQLLNSWCSMSLPEFPKEIPYSDEAALFFHNLLFGMARLSKRIQEQTFDQKNLLELIAKGGGLLLPEKT